MGKAICLPNPLRRRLRRLYCTHPHSGDKGESVGHAVRVVKPDDSLAAWVVAETPSAAHGSCWRRVALLNRCFDQDTALSGGKVLALANFASFFGQVRIVNDSAEPVRVISLMQMMQPGRIVNTLGKLYEDPEILRA